MESLPEVRRWGAGIHTRVHKAPETAVVPPADWLGVDTDGDLRKGDREQGRSTKTHGRVESMAKACRAGPGTRGQERPGLAGGIGTDFLMEMNPLPPLS